jgi:ATP-binding cassette subfamily F protein 1
MQSIDALAEALEAFGGGVVLVSHDARLISRVCGDESTSQIWVVDEGQVEFYRGDFEQFRKELVDEIKHEMDE